MSYNRTHHTLNGTPDNDAAPSSDTPGSQPHPEGNLNRLSYPIQNVVGGNGGGRRRRLQLLGC